MRWMHSVGMVRWCRFGPDLKEDLSGGVGLVRWCRIGVRDETWDFLSGNRRVRVRVGDVHNLRLAVVSVDHLKYCKPGPM